MVRQLIIADITYAVQASVLCFWVHQWLSLQHAVISMCLAFFRYELSACMVHGDFTAVVL